MQRLTTHSRPPSVIRHLPLILRTPTTFFTTTTTSHIAINTNQNKNKSKEELNDNQNEKSTKFKINYAQVTDNENTPNRKQAIVLNIRDGIVQKDYVITVDNIRSTQNFIFAKLSNPFCIFLSFSKVFDSLQEETIQVKGQEIQYGDIELSRYLAK